MAGASEHNDLQHGFHAPVEHVVGDKMSNSDEIREHVLRKYIAPARSEGSARVTVVAGDVANALNLNNRMPLVCGAIGAMKFRKGDDLQLLRRSGPGQGATETFVFAV